MSVHRLSRADARRIAVRAQLLDGRRPAERGQQPGWRASQRDWVRANDACRRDILDRLRASGPLATRELPDTTAVPWRSTGWTNNRNVSQLLEFLVLRGEVAIAGRRGGDRLWDLAERVYPDDPVVPATEARRLRDARRLRALGIARARGPECPVEPVDVGEAGEPAVVEGVRGTWRVDPGQLGQLGRPPSAAGGTSPCRSCTATGWSASSTPPPTATPGCCGSTPSTRTCPSTRP